MEPGIFSEAPAPRSSALKGLFALLALSFLLLLGYSGLQIRRLARERDRERARVDELLALLKKSATSPGTPSSAPAVSETGSEAADPAPVSPQGAPVRAPDVRVVPPPSKEAVVERLDQGKEELRAGRYPQAELHFFRALPDGHLYLVLSSLGRGDYREAVTSLSHAGAADPAWFRKVRPRDLFSAVEYERIRAALEARVRENALDADAKLLLAYLHFHEKGPAYAQSLLVEVVALKPEHAAARQFLEGIDK